MTFLGVGWLSLFILVQKYQTKEQFGLPIEHIYLGNLAPCLFV